MRTWGGCLCWDNPTVQSGYGKRRWLAMDQLGNISIFVQQPVGWMELSDTSKDGWLEDSWIGNLLPFENHWAFHERLEWIYMNSDQKGGFWIWHKVTGWIWTNPDCWPFVWSHDTANWLYLIPVRSDFLFYDYSIGSLR